MTNSWRRRRRRRRRRTPYERVLKRKGAFGAGEKLGTKKHLRKRAFGGQSQKRYCEGRAPGRMSPQGRRGACIMGSCVDADAAVVPAVRAQGGFLLLALKSASHFRFTVSAVRVTYSGGSAAGYARGRAVAQGGAGGAIKMRAGRVAAANLHPGLIRRRATYPCGPTQRRRALARADAHGLTRLHAPPEWRNGAPSPRGINTSLCPYCCSVVQYNVARRV
jgi:hypothetical protein